MSQESQPGEASWRRQVYRGAVRECVPKGKKVFRSIWAQIHGLAQPDKQPREREQGTGCGGSSWAGSPTAALTRFLSPAEAPQVPKPPLEAPDPPSRPLPPQSLEGLQPAGPEMGSLERAPIQNSPWKETSLDHPYEKPRKSSEAGSESR